AKPGVPGERFAARATAGPALDGQHPPFWHRTFERAKVGCRCRVWIAPGPEPRQKPWADTTGGSYASARRNQSRSFYANHNLTVVRPAADAQTGLRNRRLNLADIEARAGSRPKYSFRSSGHNSSPTRLFPASGC